MRHGLRLHPAAQHEFNEAAAFYDAEGPGLGSAFIDEVESALTQIREFPDAAPLARGPVRKKVIGAFPYSVVYSLVDDTVIVLALAHHRRRPFYWQGRR